MLIGVVVELTGVATGTTGTGATGAVGVVAVVIRGVTVVDGAITATVEGAVAVVTTGDVATGTIGVVTVVGVVATGTIVVTVGVEVEIAGADEIGATAVVGAGDPPPPPSLDPDTTGVVGAELSTTGATVLVVSDFFLEFMSCLEVYKFDRVILFEAKLVVCTLLGVLRLGLIVLDASLVVVGTLTKLLFVLTIRIAFTNEIGFIVFLVDSTIFLAATILS